MPRHRVVRASQNLMPDGYSGSGVGVGVCRSKSCLDAASCLSRVFSSSVSCAGCTAPVWGRISIFSLLSILSCCCAEEKTNVCTRCCLERVRGGACWLCRYYQLTVGWVADIPKTWSQRWLGCYLWALLSPGRFYPGCFLKRKQLHPVCTRPTRQEQALSPPELNAQCKCTLHINWAAVFSHAFSVHTHACFGAYTCPQIRLSACLNRLFSMFTDNREL